MSGRLPTAASELGRGARQSAPLTYLAVPVPRVLAPDAQHGVWLGGRRPQLEEVGIDQLFGELVVTALVSSPGADAQPVTARRDPAQCSAGLGSPGAPEGSLDDDQSADQFGAGCGEVEGDESPHAPADDGARPLGERLENPGIVQRVATQTRQRRARRATERAPVLAHHPVICRQHRRQVPPQAEAIAEIRGSAGQE
jgi:hypothetical protein